MKSLSPVHTFCRGTPQTRKPTNEEGCSNATPGDDGVSGRKGVGDRSWGQCQRWRQGLFEGMSVYTGNRKLMKRGAII